MKIPILHSLETRDQWQQFSMRKTAYAYIESPSILVDFQTTYLLLTQIDKDLHDGRKAIKFSVGSRGSSDAAWELIRRCKWSLQEVLAGLNTLDFSSNARDNHAMKMQGDTTVRKFFSKDKAVISPKLLLPLKSMADLPVNLATEHVKNLLCFEQYQNLEIKQNHFQFNSVKAILLQIISHPDSWSTQRKDGKIMLSFHDEMILSFSANIETLTTNTLPAVRMSNPIEKIQ